MCGNWKWVQQTSGKRCGIFGFLVDIRCNNEFAKRITQFWPPNMSKQEVGELPGSKVGAKQRVI